MARIPDDDLQWIMDNVDLAALIRSKGIELKKHGSRDLAGLSPFTDEKTPSFIVTPAKSLWHCMSSGKGGNAINFLMEFDGLSFRHAAELLLEGKVSKLSSTSPTAKKTTKALPPPVDLNADEQLLLNQIVDFYHKRLSKSLKARDYLAKRGICSEAIDAFKIGFADRTLGLRLPEKNRKDGAKVREQLQRVGLYRESGHEHFTGCVTFPIFDAKGNAVEIYGRKINDNLRKDTIYHLYLPGPHKGIVNPTCFESTSIILCESVIDALTFWSAGLKAVTCIYGIEGFSDEIFNAFVANKTQRVYIAYDNDKGGNRAAERDANRFSEVGIDCYRIKFPAGMDANSYACQMSPKAKALDTLVRSAELIFCEHRKTAFNQYISDVTEVIERDPKDYLKGTVQSTLVTKVSNLNEVAKEKSSNDVSSSGGISIKTKGDDFFVGIGERDYRVRGLHKNGSLEVLKINLRLSVGELYYLDELNLYQAKQREQFVVRAAAETKLKDELIKRDLGKLLLKLEELQEERINEALKPKEPLIEIEDSERETALALLRAPDLLNRILSDFNKCGVVGEATNKLVGYLSTVSRKMEKPLAVIIQSTSAAGKTTLMESVLSFLPEEDQIKYSAMTGQSLYYLGETNLKHKVLAIVEEEGAERASYALKLLQSEGELTIASTGKDATTGRMTTEEYHVEGPVMIFLTTTAIDIDEELMNRCIVLTVDEGKEQTAAIHSLQREGETFEGLRRNHEKSETLKIHRNAQRLLSTVNVVNPFAPYLTFRCDRTRARRDHMKYLTLIKTITLLHQYQRPLQQRDGLEFIEVTLEDIEAANKLAHEVLGRSLDELPPQTRKLLNQINSMVNQACEDNEMQQSEYRFSRRQLRNYTGMSNAQLKLHLDRLEEFEYIVAHCGGAGRQFVYELLFDGEDNGKPHLMGLIDIDELKRRYDGNLSGSEDDLSGKSD